MVHTCKEFRQYKKDDERWKLSMSLRLEHLYVSGQSDEFENNGIIISQHIDKADFVFRVLG